VRTTSSGPAKASTASGLATAGSTSQNGLSPNNTNPNSGTVAATLAHQRHLGEGSDPVGVSSSTKPIKAGITITLASRSGRPTAGGAPRQANSTQLAYP
jgi:hypothetical protein